MIRIEQVTKKYGSHVVVDEVSLDISKGKIISLIGPNGAGKSTLLGIMSRTIAANNGTVYIDNVSLDNWVSIELAKQMAIMKQSEHISVKVTIRDLIAFGRYPYSQGRLTKDDHDFIDHAIDYLDLHDISESFIDELSGGQRQRAFIASIYAQNTDYILLDEPLNNLDIKHASNMLKLLKKMAHEQNKTIVIVIHDINFAASFSDEIVLMNEGKITHHGSVDQVMTSEILEDIYQIPFEIITVNGKKFCLYY